MRRATILVLSLLIPAVIAGPAAAQAPAPKAPKVPKNSSPFERTEQRAQCADYDPLRKPLFGDTHVHTTFSFDAYIYNLRNRPRDAYRFAKGEAVWLPDALGNPTRCVQLDRPLDFTAVTDHGEFFGEVKMCTTPGLEGYDSPLCKVYRSGINPNITIAVWGLNTLNAPDPQPFGFCGANGELCLANATTFWQEVQAAAEEAYDRSPACTFTSFVGYEWSGTPGGANIHRNVIFRNEKVPNLPISYLQTGQDPQVLWSKLRKECLDAGTGCDVLTIPHNANLSGGQLFQMPKLSKADGARYAETRQFFEPLSEMVQHKGSSECRTGVQTDDPACGFEQISRTLLGGVSNPGNPPPASAFAPNAFLRNVLKDGLTQEKAVGINPFKVGFVGSTDTHSAVPGGTDEANFQGHLGSSDADPEGLLAAIDNGPGGLAVVWAEESSRDSIFAAMRRRETYATSGTRPVVRFFAGWDLPTDLCSRPDFVQTGYATGVPMGGDLKGGSSSSRSPRFAVMALKDPGTSANGEPGAPERQCVQERIGTKLQRIQVVKGWLDAAGAQHEKVWDVAGEADNGASVDPRTCAPTGPGHNSLCSVFEDPEWDPKQAAFYYTRVLENPTCRWSTFTCKRSGLDPFDPAQCSERLKQYPADQQQTFAICCAMAPGPDVDPSKGEIPRIEQERAWTSPVWYRPGTQK
jgi:hypothetical protein